MIVYQAALHIVVLIIFVAGGLLVLGAYLLYRMLAAKTSIDSDYSKRPPNVLRTPAEVVYHCEAITGKQPARPLPDADVTFTLIKGHAAIDGGLSKTVKTDAKGDAKVTLTPVSSGAEELRLHLEIGSKSGDETPIDFEVQKP